MPEASRNLAWLSRSSLSLRKPRFSTDAIPRAMTLNIPSVSGENDRLWPWQIAPNSSDSSIQCSLYQVIQSLPIWRVNTPYHGVLFLSFHSKIKLMWALAAQILRASRHQISDKASLSRQRPYAWNTNWCTSNLDSLHTPPPLSLLPSDSPSRSANSAKTERYYSVKRAWNLGVRETNDDGDGSRKWSFKDGYGLNARGDTCDGVLLAHGSELRMRTC
jgi:hypothetical protein